MLKTIKSQNPKPYSSKNNNKRLTQDQVKLLEASFSANNKLDPKRKLQLSHQLDIPPRQIAIWYQNRRARWRNQSLEHDYTTLHIHLQTVLSQKQQLEKEVQWLRLELQKSKLEQNVAQLPEAVNVSCVSSSCDEEGLSWDVQNDHLHFSWMNDQDLRVHELYTFLMSN